MLARVVEVCLGVGEVKGEGEWEEGATSHEESCCPIWRDYNPTPSTVLITELAKWTSWLWCL